MLFTRDSLSQSLIDARPHLPDLSTSQSLCVTMYSSIGNGLIDFKSHQEVTTLQNMYLYRNSSEGFHRLFHERNHRQLVHNRSGGRYRNLL